MDDEYFKGQFQADNLNVDPTKEENRSNKGNGQRLKWMPIILTVLGVIVVFAFTTLYVMNLVKGKPQVEQSFNQNPVVAQLKSQSILFCNQFFNLSYTTYKDARDKAQQYMSSNLLTQYKETFYDTPFTDQVTNSGLATDYTYNQVLEGVIDHHAAIKVIGSIKYTSIKRNVSVEMPITAVLVWLKDVNGVWKIDNLYLDM